MSKFSHNVPDGRTERQDETNFFSDEQRSDPSEPPLHMRQKPETITDDPVPSSSPLGVLGLVSTSENHHPVHWRAWKKWLIAIIYCLLQVAVTMLSTSYISAETPLQEKFGGSNQVVALGQSLFIVGNAIGPVFLGPLSDIGGRKWVYVGSIAIYGLCQIVRCRP